MLSTENRTVLKFGPRQSLMIYCGDYSFVNKHVPPGPYGPYTKNIFVKSKLIFFC